MTPLSAVRCGAPGSGAPHRMLSANRFVRARRQNASFRAASARREFVRMLVHRNVGKRIHAVAASNALH
jgi:hypothetical protein